MMLPLALLLVTVGTVDLLRHLRVPRLDRPGGAWLVGFAIALLGAWGLDLVVDEPWLVPFLLVVEMAWLVLPDVAHARARTWALITLAVAALAVAAFGRTGVDSRSALERWYDALEVPALVGVPFERFALALGCLVFLISSANVVVRLVLADAGPLVLESEQTLKGGRVLGPIERWFVFGLALAGELGAIAAIVAAKGIVRFPEISRGDTSGTKAEYVLVGSFVSWFLALVFVPLLK